MQCSPNIVDMYQNPLFLSLIHSRILSESQIADLTLSDIKTTTKSRS